MYRHRWIGSVVGSTPSLKYMFWELVFVLLIVYVLDYCLTVCIRRYRDYRVLVNIIALPIQRRGGPKARAKAALRR